MGGKRPSLFDDDDDADAGSFDQIADQIIEYIKQRKADGTFIDPAPVPPPSDSAGLALADAKKKKVVVDKLAPADLPVGAKLEKASVSAGKGSGKSCGEIKIGRKTIKLDCFDEAYGTIAGASKPAISYGDMMGGAPLPDVVDHRGEGREGPMLDQGQTLSCTAFSLVAALDQAVAARTGKPGNLSPMHAWGRYARPSMQDAESSNRGKMLADFVQLPFDERRANAWAEGAPDANLVKSADDKATVRIASITQIENAEIKHALANGKDVWFALRGAHNIQRTVGRQGVQYIPDFDYRTSPQNMGHAIVLSGYRVSNGETYYLVHNSWGPEWGDNGYAYIHEATLFRNIAAAYVVDVALKDPKQQRTPPQNTKKVETCDGGLVPDSVTGECTPKCPDGSARHNAMCPSSAKCGAGQVNVEGECVRAAPTGKFHKGDFQATCTPGGCVYTWPKGTARCTNPKGCNLSCAAPRFRLAQGPRGVSCSE